MTATLFSRDWYRIAELKPELRHHVTVHAHRYRGKRWYLLEDHISGRVQRLSAQSYLIVGLMNGVHTVDQLWDISSRRLGEEMPTHEEMLQLLASLYQASLIRMDISGDVGELFERGQNAQRQRWMAKLKSPLSIQIPLLDPERFLVAGKKWVAPLFTKTFALIWCVLVATALVIAGQHWEELTKNITDRVLTADNLVLLWLVYPVIKLLHELGHGFAVKRGGGSVHELGVMLLVMIPMPYVDASASSAFADKKQRILVGAAGILVELFIAAIAMLVWVNAEPGFIKSIAYNVVFVAGVSTVMVNGNPLLRFDGYYVLADFLEIPNLAQRANQYWAWLVKRIIFGVKGHASPAYDKREAAWFFFYGVGALVYRLVLMVTIVLFVAQKYFIVGVVLALWSFIGTWAWPNLKLLQKSWNDSDIRSGTRSPKIMMPLCAGVIILVFCILPFPITTSIEGVVQMGEDRRVVTNESCFVQELVKKAGSYVHKGDQLMNCENKQLHTQHEVLKQQYAEAQAQRQGAWNDPVQIKISDEELMRLSKEIAENQKQLESLQLYAAADGIWQVKNPADILGRYVMRGDLIGYVMDDKQVKVRAMIPETSIKLVRERTRKVHVIKAANLSAMIEPDHWQVFPSASKALVSQILTQNAGGKIIMDPSAKEPKTLQQYFLVDLEFAHFPATHVDERIYVQFEHAPEALVYRGYRLVRRTFLEYFDV